MNRERERPLGQGRGGTSADARTRHPTAADGRMPERIRALLAKAESTTFPDEAEALTAKAQELMARHAIDEAMLAAHQPGGAAAPDGRGLRVDDPYANAKSELVAEVASANRCRAVWSAAERTVALIGFPGDLDFVELLYTSLLVQAGTAMMAAGPQVDRYGRSRTRSFRQAFWVAYAMRIGQRLQAAQAESEALAAERYGEALVPVLARRSDAVDAAFDVAFPHVLGRCLTVSNRAGWEAGRMAADLSSLTVQPEVSAGRR